MSRQILGKSGEKVASIYLQKLGLRILKNNYRCKYGEVDIVAQDKETLVIVEVKSAFIGSTINPIEQIIDRKIKKLILLSKIVLNEYERFEKVRIDFVGVVFNQNMSVNKVDYRQSIGY